MANAFRSSGRAYSANDFLPTWEVKRPQTVDEQKAAVESWQKIFEARWS